MTDIAALPTAHKGVIYRSQFEAQRAIELHGLVEGCLIGQLRSFVTIRLTESRVPFTASFAYISDRVQVYEFFKVKKDPRVKDLVRMWPRYGSEVLLLTEIKCETLYERRVISHEQNEIEDDRHNR